MSNPTLRCDAVRAAGADGILRRVLAAALALGLGAGPPAVLAATELSSVPLPTLSTGSGVDIKPNVLMVLDDSGSMNWDFLPDWANDRPGNYESLPLYLTRNASFNGVAYNPAVRYEPPVTFNASGAKDTSTFPAMTGTTAATGADPAQPLPNWKAVVFDGYQVQRNEAGRQPLTDLEAIASFHTIVPGEFCDSPALTNCTASTVPTGSFRYPAPLRWCSNNALTTCRGLWSRTYDRPRIAAPRMATISFADADDTSVASIMVDGQEILPAPTRGDDEELAERVAEAINRCEFARTGNCTVAGYRAFADRNGTTVRVYAPGATGATPAVSSSRGVTATAFARQNIPLPDWHNGNGRSTSPVPGENLRTVITRGVNSYPYPGTAAKAAGRTDCAGSTCTFQEEMTNFANWWAYYRTRMQMMKTATGRAFAALDSDADIAAGRSRYRIGYLSINNNTGGDFVNVEDFGAGQKFTWYSKLFAARPDRSTPLRAALSTAGRLYGGVLNGSTLNGTVVTEPMQFSCQHNYTILSSDGFWNGAGGVKLDGTTAVDNEDGPMPRPYSDGGNAQNQARTSRLQQRVSTQTAELGTLQRQVSQLQAMTSQLQRRVDQLQTRTSRDGGATWSDWSNASSCSPDNAGSDRRECRMLAGTFSNVSSCNAGSSGGQTIVCQYADGPWADASSCTPVAKSAGPSFSVGVARSCRNVVSAPFTNAASCTPTTAPNPSGQTTQCQYAFAPAAPTQSCTPGVVAGDFRNSTVFRNCTTLRGTFTDVASCTASSTPDALGEIVECEYSSWSAWANVASCTAVAQSPGPSFTVGTARECQLSASGGTGNTLADVAAYYYTRDLRDRDASGADATGTCTGPIVPPATTPSDLCANNVRPSGRDTSDRQHMTTHTLGLGAQGQMVYSHFQNDLSGQRVFQPDYWEQQSGDFFAVANGSIASPSTNICPWMPAGSTCSWPAPAPDSTANIDDLWHAAVNGHGTYFSAADPVSLRESLGAMLARIDNPPRPGTAAAAASSNPNVSSSDNFVFSSSYKSIDWFGELVMQRIDPNGRLTEQQWSAMQLLDCATTPWRPNRGFKRSEAFQQAGVCYAVVTDYTSGDSFDASLNGTDGQNVVALPGTPVTRTILTVGNVGGAARLVPFAWASLDTSLRNLFSRSAIGFVSASQGLTQFCGTGATCLSSEVQEAAAGEALVNFLRGDRSKEGSWYRRRVHVLGDIVNAEARYVKQPVQDYVDAGFSAFKAAMATRVPTVYAAANDGMLHAFDALTGEERWAFIPSAVLPELYRLADSEYAVKHRYFVDGTPEVGEICPRAPGAACTASEWRTILVGGLNQGGKAFYALDITDPASPSLLWEFTHADLGFSYGNPRITKLRNGTWAVIVASGYNNADGVGRVFVLNAATGALLNTISTGVGTAAAPSGLARLQARAPNAGSDNTVEQVYGGDLLGNLWRFDVNDTIGAGGTDAQLLVQLRDGAGNPQPITAKPVVSAVASSPLVIVGTGRYLGWDPLESTCRHASLSIL